MHRKIMEVWKMLAIMAICCGSHFVCWVFVFFVAELTVIWWWTSVLLSGVYIRFTRLPGHTNPESRRLSSSTHPDHRYTENFKIVYTGPTHTGPTSTPNNQCSYTDGELQDRLPGSDPYGSTDRVHGNNDIDITRRELQDLLTGPDPHGSTDYTERPV